MTAPAITPYRSQQQVRDGFGQVLRAEWTKFRTVRGWVIGMVVAALATVLFGLLAGGGAHIGCRPSQNGPMRTGRACMPHIPLGPDGQPVSDSFYFVRQPLPARGSLTVRLTSLTGRINDGPIVAGQPTGGRAGLVPWAKAGIIIAASARPGSAYAAMMATGAHGVRLQYDYVHDTAGPPGAVSAATPRWLRLTRSGATVTGYESADGSHWTRVGTVTLRGMAGTAQAGMFVASPQYTRTQQGFGGASGESSPTVATAVFDRVSMTGSRPDGWAGGQIGSRNAPRGGGLTAAGGTFTVSGTGDIAPFLGGHGQGGFPTSPIEDHLVGAFAGLIAVAVIGAMFITAEYRRGLIRLTLAASPRRGQVLAAKAIVVAAAAFVAGLAGAVAAVAIGTRLATAMGMYVPPVSVPTEVRVVAGTAALLAVAAVLALAIGVILRRSAAAVTIVIVTIVLPYILAVAAVLPASAAQWLTRLTPAAAFAIQQSEAQYSQVSATYTPASGYFPLAPWAGFAVLCGYTALALGLAVLLLRRRDA